jgi:hypothetical protein
MNCNNHTTLYDFGELSSVTIVVCHVLYYSLIPCVARERGVSYGTIALDQRPTMCEMTCDVRRAKVRKKGRA